MTGLRGAGRDAQLIAYRKETYLRVKVRRVYIYSFIYCFNPCVTGVPFVYSLGYSDEREEVLIQLLSSTFVLLCHQE